MYYLDFSIMVSLGAKNILSFGKRQPEQAVGSWTAVCARVPKTVRRAEAESWSISDVTEQV